MGKVIIFLILCAAAAGYWFVIHKENQDMKSGNSEIYKKEIAEQKATFVPKGDYTEASASDKFPPEPGYNPAPGSLAAEASRLASIKDGTNLSPEPVLINGIKNKQKVKANLAIMSSKLQSYRNLQNYTELGIPEFNGHPHQLISYVHEIPDAIKWLLLSGEYQLKYGNKQQGEKDLVAAARIFRVYCSDVKAIMHIFSIIATYIKYFDHVIPRCNLSPAKKKNIIAILPSRSRDLFADYLQSGFVAEKKMLMFIRKWHKHMDEATLNAVLKNQATRNCFKSIPPHKLASLLDSYYAFLVKSFRNNTLRPDTPVNIGNAEENKMLECIFPPSSVCNIEKVCR